MVSRSHSNNNSRGHGISRAGEEDIRRSMVVRQHREGRVDKVDRVDKMGVRGSMIIDLSRAGRSVQREGGKRDEVGLGGKL